MIAPLTRDAAPAAIAPRREIRRITAALRHPAVARARNRIRDVIWRLRGMTIANPPLPSAVESVLFVCLGNICRSPFAAILANQLAASGDAPRVRFASAGIRARADSRSPADASQAAAGYGVALEAHTPQPLTDELLCAHDAIVVFEYAHLRQLGSMYPSRRNRIFLLPLFDAAAAGAFERYNIADPFGGPPEMFELCYRRIHRALRRWTASVPTGAPGAPSSRSTGHHP